MSVESGERPDSQLGQAGQAGQAGQLSRESVVQRDCNYCCDQMWHEV